MILCDTDVIIEYMKGNEVAKKEIVEIGINNITVSSVSLIFDGVILWCFK
jgi:predicted nucleic acid-binding protein